MPTRHPRPATRRGVLAGLALVPTIARIARAQPAFPTRPLRLIVTYPPGGVTDIVARLVAEPLGVALGQAVVVENRTGAGGNIGVQAAVAAEPDGYTLMLGTVALFGVNPVLYAGTGVDATRDLVPVGTLGENANVLSVHPRRLPEVRDVAGLVAHAKRTPLLYGSVGNGSSSHMAAVALLQRGGFEATHVPYRGSSPAVAAMLSGEFDFFFDTTATSTAHVRSGAFRALAVTTAQRASGLPEVPTMIEAGFPGFDLSVWYGVFAPARTPAPVLARLADALEQARTPAFADRLRVAQVEPLAVPRADLPRWLAADAARWQALARASNIRAD